jgi:hypothetical protein
LRDRQDLSRFPLARLPAGFADRVLISHRGVGAFAPASLSDAVYRFEAVQLSNKNRKFFELFYKSLKKIDKIFRALCVSSLFTTLPGTFTCQFDEKFLSFAHTRPCQHRPGGSL